MDQRINYGEVASQGISILAEMEKYIRNSTIDSTLLELIKTRSSQINGCAFCLDMHTKDARKNGESEQRLYGLSAWRDSPFYSDKERAVLEWTEAVTKISEHQVNDETYNRLLSFYSEKEVVDITLAIISINSWNRLAISFKTVAGTYMPNSPVAQKGK